LKVLGESGTSSASRSQHPLVAILCVGIAWLVDCLHGGDRTTQFWGVAGMDQFIVAHCKANSLPFVKVKDSNMMNQIFRQGQQLVQHDPATGSKWRVLTSEAAEGLSHRASAGRNCSPFRLLLDEVVLVGNLIASSDYGKVGHAIDLARDITQLNGTTNEQIQLIAYTRAFGAGWNLRGVQF
ncbi:hypothetical protein PHYSODRAFT_493698, partial [Phytophthora sojae]